MGDKAAIMMAARSGRTRRIAIWASSLAIGCSLLATPASTQSLTDRFKSLFGGKTEEPAQGVTPNPADADNELSCPPVSIRAGASTFAVGVAGKPAVGNDLRYQATITRTARDCTKSGDQIIGRIGILGRVIVGPAGGPPTVEIPLRVAVVQGGVQEKTIATKVFKTTVTMDETGNVPFSLVAEDVTYPVPPGALGDTYIFYIGFDPQALAPERPAKPVKKKK
jgi:hypothetical protein